MSDPFLGEIRIFAGNFAPRGFALCAGQILSIQQNSALFSLLGTFYGGNGTTNFALPDLRGRVPIHQGQGAGLSSYVLGEKAGVETVNLLLNQMPTHTHAAHSNDGGTPANSPSQATWMNWSQNEYALPSTANGTMSGAALQFAGGNQPHANIQPVLTINFIIALSGIYPARN